AAKFAACRLIDELRLAHRRATHRQPSLPPNPRREKQLLQAHAHHDPLAPPLAPVPPPPLKVPPLELAVQVPVSNASATNSPAPIQGTHRAANLFTDEVTAIA